MHIHSPEFTRHSSVSVSTAPAIPCMSVITGRSLPRHPSDHLNGEWSTRERQKRDEKHVNCQVAFQARSCQAHTRHRRLSPTHPIPLLLACYPSLLSHVLDQTTTNSSLSASLSGHCPRTCLRNRLLSVKSNEILAELASERLFGSALYSERSQAGGDPCLPRRPDPRHSDLLAKAK